MNSLQYAIYGTGAVSVAALAISWRKKNEPLASTLQRIGLALVTVLFVLLALAGAFLLLLEVLVNSFSYDSNVNPLDAALVVLTLCSIVTVVLSIKRFAAKGIRHTVQPQANMLGGAIRSEHE